MNKSIDTKTKLLSENEVMLEGITRRTAKIGAKVFSTSYGVGIIINMTNTPYEIVAEFTIDGKLQTQFYTTTGSYIEGRYCELYVIPPELKDVNLTRPKVLRSQLILKLKSNAKKVRTN